MSCCEQRNTNQTDTNCQTKTPGFTLEWKLIFCAFFSFPLILHMFLHYQFLHNPWLQFLLCTPVFFVALNHFGKSAISSFRSGRANMDLLVISGIVTAYLYSILSITLLSDSSALFFETAATITTLMLLGAYMEKRAVARTTSAVKELANLQPMNAKKITANGISVVPISELVVGDKIRVVLGDQVPTDGKIEVGAGAIDESMITGESEAIKKNIGDTIIGGTVITDGTFEIKVNAVGSETVLARIIELVKQAEGKRPQIQKLGDKISSYFVPTIFAIATITLLGWLASGADFKAAFMTALAVIVISCPCAMGLATPTAVAVGLGRAAKKGILIKGGDTAELLSKVKTVVFDKTGTLTTGLQQIMEIKTIDADLSFIKSLLFSVEQHSNHPIARSIVKALTDVEEITLQEIKELRGMGMIATDKAGATYKIGSFIDSQFSLTVLKDEKLIATIELEDQLANGAFEAIETLKQLGITVVLLSGDKDSKCKKIAEQLGIDQVYSEKKPEEKLELLQELKRSGVVAFVGDGINDAPALVSADVGISFSNASDVSINAAQVIILKHNLLTVIEALKLGATTYRTVVQNLFWAFFYNIVAIPVAAMGGLSPMLSALSMAFSDLIIVGNSLLLRVKRLR